MYSHEEHVDDLLDVAHDLIGLPSFPKRAVKCRIVSTLYYALFRELCGSNADALIGTELRKAWGEVFRALRHGNAKQACKRLENMQEFPKEVRAIAYLFEQSQDRRHRADYHPSADFDEVDVQKWCRETRQIIAEFRKVSSEDKRAFAAWILMTGPGVEEMREEHNNTDNSRKTQKGTKKRK